MPYVLEARNVTKIFGGSGLIHKKETVALENLSMVIKADPASITGIAGESGSGKSTLARLLMGFIHPTEGKVLYQGKELRRLTREEKRTFRKEVQAVFQDPFSVYNPFYKIDHTLYTPLKKFRIAASQDQAQKMIEGALETIGLNPEETLGRFPHQLSGGQRQRVMVARALLLKPRVILADEPVSMIDASLRATILQSLRRLNQEFGISILYISHDLTTIYQISDHIIVLYRGSVAEIGDVAKVIKEPKHPYTQLLVESIPQPDPEKRWAPNPIAFADQGSNAKNRGCKFAGTCPFVIPDLCRITPPPLYRVNRNRAVRCFLYRDAPEIPGAAMGQVLDH
ncbi:MAG: ABC transporter ATP-binding protein [Desulfobacterales bacterium]|nr:MAG: ABC transporter ATP-binding protein [Desulfobacterales bacterium]